jgi:hypothetical protein
VWCGVVCWVHTFIQVGEGCGVDDDKNGERNEKRGYGEKVEGVLYIPALQRFL